MPEVLKKAARRAARALGESPLLWKGVGVRLVHLGDLLRRGRQAALQDAEAALRASPLFAERCVLGGLFAGLRYPSPQSYDSLLFPKLTGSYECEIVPWLERLRSRPYSTIHNIGCAEGYYAVGLARMFPRSTIHAYDSDPAAQEACRRTALENGVADRVAVAGPVAAEDLCRLDPRERALVVCDCEGCEVALFGTGVARHLAGYDLIVELHDFIDPSVSATLRERFRATHDVATVRTVPRNPARFPVLRSLPPLAREVALDEVRPGPMEWLLAESRGQQ